jgi:hypothetical protein
MRSVGWLAAGLPAAFAFFDGIIPEDVVVPALPTRTPSPALQDGEIGALPIPRMLTAAPVARDLFKRDTRTCGMAAIEFLSQHVEPDTNMPRLRRR